MIGEIFKCYNWVTFEYAEVAIRMHVAVVVAVDAI